MPQVLLGGVMMAAAKAALSPDDRGFRFGDGLFETIAVVGGVPYDLAAHITRLRDGLAALRIDYDTHVLTDQLQCVIAVNELHDGVARIVLTRGSGSRGYLPTGAEPTCYIEAVPSPLKLLEADKAPITMIVSHWRRPSPEVMPAAYKLTQGVPSTLARLEAQEAGADEALMPAQDGMMAEAASGNLFWRIGGQLYTPPLSTGCLAGTMRRTMMRLATKHNRPVTERAAPIEALIKADALLMSNALQGAVPVHSLMHGEGYHFPASTSLAQEMHAWVMEDIAADRAAFHKKSLQR